MPHYSPIKEPNVQVEQNGKSGKKKKKNGTKIGESFRKSVNLGFRSGRRRLGSDFEGS